MAGFLGPIIDSQGFIEAQLPTSFIKTTDSTSQLLAWQLGNCYALLGLLGLFILNTTSELKVVRAYLWALWIGDIGHVAFTVYAMGVDATLDVSKWTAVTWGNIGATLFLFITRSMYFAGIFGGIEVKKSKVKR